MLSTLTRSRTRIVGFVLAFSVFAYSLSTLSVHTFVVETSTVMASAAVGVVVGVPENKYNTLAKQLAEKEDALTAREQALNAQAQESAAAQSFAERFGVVAFGFSAVALALILLNFYFDYRRGREDRSRGIYEVNLRGS
jgi:LPS O-antigen subunit length determinant protein (WzzB/FepE family)